MQKKFRLKKNEEFKKLIESRKFINNKTFTFYFLNNNLGYSRFGISVGKKHGNAVERNKIKRQIRMMISQTFEYDKSLDYVVMIRKDFHEQSYEVNLKKMKELSTRIEDEV